MGRITRKKAAEVAEALHIDEDAVLELENENEVAKVSKGIKEMQLELVDRPPLGELENNSLETMSEYDQDAQELKKSTRGKKGSKRGTKKKHNFAASTASVFDYFENAPEQQAVSPDENDTTPSPASEEAAGVLLQDRHKDAGDLSEQTKAGETAFRPTRSTRNRPANETVEPKSLVDGLGQSKDEEEAMKEEVVGNVNETDDVVMNDPAMHTALDAPASPLPGAVPTIIAKLRAESPAKRSTSNKENIEPMETASPQTTPSVLVTEPTAEQPAQPPLTPSDPITALDALDEAVDNVNKDIPDVQTSPEKPKVKRDTKKAAPVVRGTKASQARISLAQNPEVGSKAPTLGQPRPSTTLGRSNSVKPSSATSKPDLASSKRATSSTHAKDGAEKKEVHIPHSKPRPVSLSFPTPPPRAKSTKAPTQSTFQLSGEAVAAKLKAAKEARQQKEAEEQKKPSFKARPVPASLSKAPSMAPRQNVASKARESIMAGKDGKTGSVAPNAAQKRLSSMNTKAPVSSKPRVVSTDTSRPISSRPAPSDLAVKKRPLASSTTTTTQANTSKPRSLAASTTHSPNTAAQRVPSTATTAKGTSKGKEVFNRAAAAKADADKEKAEREAAAKKARAEAAERGRQASRAWAEKQKKAAEAKKTGQTAEPVAAEEKVMAETTVDEKENLVAEEPALTFAEGGAAVESPAAAVVEVA